MQATPSEGTFQGNDHDDADIKGTAAMSMISNPGCRKISSKRLRRQQPNGCGLQWVPNSLLKYHLVCLNISADVRKHCDWEELFDVRWSPPNQRHWRRTSTSSSLHPMHPLQATSQQSFIGICVTVLDGPFCEALNLHQICFVQRNKLCGG